MELLQRPEQAVASTLGRPVCSLVAAHQPRRTSPLQPWQGVPVPSEPTPLPLGALGSLRPGPVPGPSPPALLSLRPAPGRPRRSSGLLLCLRGGTPETLPPGLPCNTPFPARPRLTPLEKPRPCRLPHSLPFCLLVTGAAAAPASASAAPWGPRSRAAEAEPRHVAATHRSLLQHRLEENAAQGGARPSTCSTQFRCQLA